MNRTAFYRLCFLVAVVVITHLVDTKPWGGQLLFYGAMIIIGGLSLKLLESDRAVLIIDSTILIILGGSLFALAVLGGLFGGGLIWGWHE